MTPSLIQAGAQTFHAVSPPYAVSFVASVTAGNTLLIFASSDVTTSAWSATDSVNGATAYTLVPGSKETQFSLQGLYIPNTAGGACTTTVVMTPGTSGGIIYWAEIAGIGTTPVVNTSFHNTGTSTTPASSITTTVNGCFIIAACRTAGDASIGSGWTLGGDDANGDVSEYRVQSASGPITAGFTQASAQWSVSVIAFEPGVAIETHNTLPASDTVTTGWSATPLFSKVNDGSDATVITSTLASASQPLVRPRREWCRRPSGLLAPARCQR